MRRISIRTEKRAIVSMLDSRGSTRNKVLSTVRLEHFGHPPAAEVYERIIAYVRGNKDIPTARVLAEDPALSKKAKSFLKADLSRKQARHPLALKGTREVPTVVEKLEKYRKQRMFFDSAKGIAEEIEKDQPDHDALAANLENTLVSLRSSTGAEMVHAGDGGNDQALFTRIIDGDSPLEIIPTGIDTFDEHTGGFARTNLVFLAANYGGGKSVCGMQLGLNMYRKGFNVLWVSLEMDEDEAWERIWSCVSGVEHDPIRRHKLTSKQKKTVERARKDFYRHGKKRKCRFSTYHPGYIDPWQLTSEIRGFDFDVVIVDYIGLMKPPPGTPNEERIQLGEIAKVLKIVAGKRYLNCAMIVEAQLNDDNRLKYSRAMAEHANNILWWRMDDRAREKGEVIVHQDKARNSRLYDFYLKFDFATMTMYDGGLVEGANTSGMIKRKGQGGGDSEKGSYGSSERRKGKEKRKREPKAPKSAGKSDRTKNKKSSGKRRRGVMPELTSM